MNQDKIYDIAIVGGGIVGVATLYQMQLKFSHLKILLIEKEDHLAAHQTGNNSGVIHSGLYYKPGSQKAITCVRGRRALVKFSKEYNIDHEVCGKVVVATEEAQLPFMEKIFANGLANDTEDIEKITGDQVREIEPFCNSIGGIRVGCTGIINYVQATDRMAELALAIQPESKVSLEDAFIHANHEGGVSSIKTEKTSYKAKHMIYCGGLQSDRLAKDDGVDLDMQIVGFRGDYYELNDQGKHKVKHLIYPVPNPAFPFLGVHFTRMTDGEIECGPNAVFTFKREGYGKTDFDLKDTMDALGYIGTWKLFAKHWKFGLDEYKRAFSKRLFLERLQELIPSLTMDDIRTGRAGVRAMALGPDGEMIEDFKIEYKNNSIHVLNAPSPAATACLAIGEDIATMAQERFNLH
ncbi:L-2-hydroxyglutarate oxidase [Vicingaceae bacterium]|nr:L-2-hydroxyglutarate oxidase [Vicingaceae bacterium]MDB4060657.1 L-2-hydroxyglutarate oxidase [Vicingaceae bacterium]